MITANESMRKKAYKIFSVVMLVILALNLLGDGLRDALDPRLK